MQDKTETTSPATASRASSLLFVPVGVVLCAVGIYLLQSDLSFQIPWIPYDWKRWTEPIFEHGECLILAAGFAAIVLPIYFRKRRVRLEHILSVAERSVN